MGNLLVYGRDGDRCVFGEVDVTARAMLRPLLVLLLLCAVPGMGHDRGHDPRCPVQGTHTYEEHDSAIGWTRAEAPPLDWKSRLGYVETANGLVVLIWPESMADSMGGTLVDEWCFVPTRQSKQLETRIDSLEAKLARAHVVVRGDSAKIKNFSGPVVVHPVYVIPPDSIWHRFTRYEISFEPEKSQ